MNMYNPVFASEALARKEKIQAALRRLPADALLLADNANLYYTSSRVFCGYTYVPAEGDMIYFVRRPVGLAGDNVVYIRKPEQIIEEMQKRGLPLPQTLLVEGDSLSYNEYTRLASAFPSSRILPGGTALIRQVRAVKTPFEIGMIRQSAASHDMLYRHIPKLYTPGMTDLEFSIEIERAARQHGSLGIFRIFGRSMEIFMGNVLAGENADTPTPYDFAMGGAGLDDSLPIGCNGTTIHPGQTVMVDVNGNFTGYMTDLSRVYSLGEIPEKARHAHAVSLEIEQAVMSMARPGVAASELYDKALAIARDRKVEDWSKTILWDIVKKPDSSVTVWASKSMSSPCLPLVPATCSKPVWYSLSNPSSSFPEWALSASKTHSWSPTMAWSASPIVKKKFVRSIDSLLALWHT